MEENSKLNVFERLSGGVGRLAAKIRAGDRRALARAITLVESTCADHNEQAQSLLTALMPHTGGAMRVGISGSPAACRGAREVGTGRERARRLGRAGDH